MCNAIKACDKFLDWNSYSVDDLLEAHCNLTEGLIDQSGIVTPEVERLLYTLREKPLLNQNILHFLGLKDEMNLRELYINWL